MKIKCLVFLSVLLLAPAFIFAQKTDPPKAPVKAADVKGPEPTKLPSVSEILARYVRALGGREAVEKIKTRASKGTIEMSPMGLKGTFEEYSAAPNKSHSVANIEGVGLLIETFDGKNGWSLNPVQGSRNKTGQELAQTMLASNFYREINLDKLYPKMEIKGVEKVGDKDAYVVVAAADGVPTETYFFETVSGLIVRTDGTAAMPEGNIAIKGFYDDYREVDGVKIPFKVRVVLPQAELVRTTTEVKSNPPISDTRFQKPE